MAPTLVAHATRPLAAGRGFRLQGVTHRYEGTNGTVTALSGLDLDVAAGEFLTVVGPSGCGKTTLLQLLAGFVTPTDGAVTAGDVPVTGPASDRGVVFQHPTSLYPWLSVRENVELGLRLRGVGRAARRERAVTELDRVGLGEFAERATYELSGGMQQRCQIARVLANDPDIMLMDEPFGAVDALTREHLQEQIRELWHSTGRTVILITHSVEEAVLLGSRVLVMSPRPGRIVLDLPIGFSRTDASTSELRTRPEFAATAHRVRATIAQGIP